MSEDVSEVISPVSPDLTPEEQRSLARLRSNANLRPFQKGQSGNPDGRNTLGAYHKARAICAKATEAAAHEQVRLMLNSDDDRVRYMCTEAVLRRGAGVPRDHSAEDNAANHINLANLTPDQQRSLAQLLAAVLGGNVLPAPRMTLDQDDSEPSDDS